MMGPSHFGRPARREEYANVQKVFAVECNPDRLASGWQHHECCGGGKTPSSRISHRLNLAGCFKAALISVPFPLEPKSTPSRRDATPIRETKTATAPSCHFSRIPGR